MIKKIVILAVSYLMGYFLAFHWPKLDYYQDIFPQDGNILNHIVAILLTILFYQIIWSRFNR